MPARFIGQYEHSLDEKGRVVLPAKLRDCIDPKVDGKSFVVTPGPEDCLFLYTDAEWDRMCEQMEALPKGSPELRQFQRQWHANAEPVGIDKQGRILVPERQRSLVKIQKEIVFAGCQDRIEVWAKAAWDANQASARASFTSQVQEFLGPRSE